MPVLLQFCQTLYDFSDRYRRVFLAQNPLDRHVRDEHQEIMQAAVTRKPRKAVDLLRKHVERTSANVLTALARAQER
jgi:DNA-binding GntR family transcriptional regulator